MTENTRIADKLMIALPLELNQEQRYELRAKLHARAGQRPHRLVRRASR